jgi:hypothetical protein
MEDNIHIARIATALEKIATLMENAQTREINMAKKARVEENRASKAKLMEQLKRDARQRASDKKASQSPKK